MYLVWNEIWTATRINVFIFTKYKIKFMLRRKFVALFAGEK